NNPVAASISYSRKTRTATLIPTAPLIYSSNYSATVKGGATGPVIKDTLGIALQADYVWTFTSSPPPAPPPDEGTGGPVLIISSSLNPFSRYPVEILRAEGYNSFVAKDLTEMSAAVLDSFDVAILGDVKTAGLPASDLTILTNW